MFFGSNVLITGGTINDTAQMFSLLFNSNHYFLTLETFALVGTDADIGGIHDFSLVGSAKVLLKAGFSIKGTFAARKRSDSVIVLLIVA